MKAIKRETFKERKRGRDTGGERERERGGGERQRM